MISTTIGERIRQVRGSTSRKDFAPELSIHVTTLQRYEDGERSPDAEFLSRLCRWKSIRADWLLTGEGPMSREPHIADESGGYAEDASAAELVIVRDIGIELENDALPGTGANFDRLAFKRAWIERELMTHVSDLALVTVASDAMEPTIRLGSVVLVDRSRPAITEDGIYVIRLGTNPLVRRLQRTYEGGIYVRCDNAAYHDQKIEDHDVQSLDILGRVVWLGMLTL